MDETRGHADGIYTVMDPIRSDITTSDTNLQDFLSRPRLLQSIEIATGVDYSLEIFPWEEFLNSPYIQRRFWNYKLMNCQLHLKFVINGSPFHYGRVMCSYTPLSGFDDMTSNTLTEIDFVGLSQRPHVYLNPTDCKGGEILCPFMWHKNSFDIISGTDFLDIGSLKIRTITPIKHAAGQTDPVTMSVYAWAENVTLSTPTNHLPLNVNPPPSFIREPNSTEYETGPVSRPSSVISAIASKLTDVPVIGPFALATSIGAKALGRIASLFGYSRPVMVQSNLMRPVPKGSIATMNQDDDCQKLSLDVKQELTLDPTTFGGQPGRDEMEIKYLAGTESYLTNFTVPLAGSAEQLLWNCVVDPQVKRIEGSGNASKMHFPACCFASMPFLKWRGSMEYRFQIVCSAYHRGRIKIVWDPEGTFGDKVTRQAAYETAYTSVVDFRDTTDFTMKVGWGQAKTYRDVFPVTNPQSLMFSTNALVYNTSIEPYGNGTISVYLVTELAVPVTTVDNDIQVNVFIKAGDDFEVAMPSGEALSNLRLKSPADVPIPARIPNSKEEETGATQDKESDVPETTPTVSKGFTTSLSDMANMIHFGESIRSFRQLLKRYSRHEVVSITRDAAVTDDSYGVYHYIQRPTMPFEPGFTSTFPANTSVRTPYLDIEGKNYAFGFMHPLRYFSSAFACWRGGIRWIIDGSGILCPCEQEFLTVNRYANCACEDSFVLNSGGTGNLPALGAMYTFLADNTMQEGGVITSSEVNPLASFEVPYYSEYRFCPSRSFYDFSEDGSKPWMPCYKAKYYNTWQGATTTGVRSDVSQYSYPTYAAAAEDFQVSGFIGAPPFYYEATRPV